MSISKGSGLNAEWGESPHEPVTVKLQLREISQIRACAWNKKALPRQRFAFTGKVYLSAESIRRHCA